ncbi:hypothetical protein HYT17_00730 [Candidatus Microgenomates bacterium]|nr:hypothetical protein [Candidatus Microgenomates bacterium]
MESIFFGVSLTAAFLGGMVALFAPCCLTFLFPAYLGTIFKEKGRVIFLTLVFALGIGVILVPVALGFRFIVSFFNEFHTIVYLLGALMLVVLGLMTFFETKVMLPFLPSYNMPKQVTVGSTFVLGVVSGITSSCCAPVLAAAITLSSLSPTTASALVVAIVYVLGIVAPLFFLSLIYDKVTNDYLAKVKKTIQKPLKLLASAVFIISGIIIAILALQNRIQMGGNEGYSSAIRNLIYALSSSVARPWSDILVLAVIIIMAFLFIKEIKSDKR